MSPRNAPEDDLHAPTPGNADVIIAGAGPTGLALAVALADRGVDLAVYEAEESPGRESSRATTVHAGSLELLDTVDVGHRLADLGARATRSRVFRAGRLLVDQDWTRLPSRYAFMLNLPQAEIERVLRERLAELGQLVHYGCSVGTPEVRPDGVVVPVTRSGRLHHVRCAFLVGCDGARSTVRRSLGLTLEGKTYPGHFVLADVELATELPRDSTWLGGSSGGLLGFLPTPDGGWRLNGTLDQDADPGSIDFERLVDERLPRLEVRIAAVRSRSVYTIHQRRTSRVREGGVLLAGDAAHLNSPIGGQGMNLGFRDALDLGWRLERVLSEGPSSDGEGLLDEWEAERQADAANVLAGSDRLTRMLRAKGLRAIPTRVLLPVASRIPAIHDRVQNEMAQLEAARRIRERVAATPARGR